MQPKLTNIVSHASTAWIAPAICVLLSVAAAYWTVNQFAAPSDRWLPLVVLLGGITISLLLFGLTRSPATSGSKAIELADRKELEQRYHDIFEQAPVGIARTSLDGRYLHVNHKFGDMLGCSMEELLTLSPQHFILPDERAGIEQDRNKMLNGEIGTVTGERRFVRKDGRVIWANRTLSLVRDSAGQPVYFIAVVEDITESKEREERYRAMFENAAVGITRLDLNGVLVDVNQKFCDMLGYARAELIGKAVAALNHPDELGQMAALRNQVIRGEIKSAIGEKRFVRKDGAVIWALRTISIARNYAGDPQYVISVVEDITDRKQAEMALHDSETRYRSVVAAIAEGIILRDKNAKIIDCNASAERILGRTLDQMRGNPYFDPSWEAIHEDGSLFLNNERPANAALSTGKPQSGVVIGLRKPDGAVLWLTMNAQPVFDESAATLFGAVTTITDITQRKHAESLQAMEHTVTRVLAEAETLAEAIPGVIRIMCETLGWHCGARWELDKETRLLRCIECWGIDMPEIQEFIADNSKRTLDPKSMSGQGLARRIYNTGQPVWLADISQEKGLLRAALVIKAGLHGVFGFPLLLGDEVLGLMEFFHRDIRKPDDMLMQVARAIGSQIGQLIARKQAEERIRHLANYDELTGLPNRSMFHERLHHALAQAQRRARPLAVLFIDLDYFKNINDTVGHEAGDRVLKEVAERLHGCLRDSDTVGRLGGDEFVVLIEELPQPVDVAAVAQKILDAVARPFILAAQEFRLGASIGISAFPADGKDTLNLLKNADAAMYRAKEQGRNNYQFYSAPAVTKK